MKGLIQQHVRAIQDIIYWSTQISPRAYFTNMD